MMVIDCHLDRRRTYTLAHPKFTQLLNALEDLLKFHSPPDRCPHGWTTAHKCTDPTCVLPDPPLVDSMALDSHAGAMRLLALHGRFVITLNQGHWVKGYWPGGK